ncbi:MAG: hypothetical protein J0L78_00820 [Planctomycetes bacterium]|nr:hypothetical protein [Planctomycetota bacterium]
MQDEQADWSRREVLLSSAAMLLAANLSRAAASTTPKDKSAMTAENDKPGGNGKPGEFSFLDGNWKIKHRRLKEPHGKEWDEFEGEATCWSILGGVGSVEELRIPSRNFAGMGLRLLDVEKKIWNDFWVNGKSGVLTTPGQTGGFENGVGTFGADDKDGDKPIKVKGVWDRITPTSCRWWQAVSWDDGKTWEENWFMDWTKA